MISEDKMADKENNLKNDIKAFREISEQLNSRLTPLVHMSEQLSVQLNASFEPIRKIMDQFEEWNKATIENLKTTLEVIHQIQQNHQEGKEIRGEIITDIIDLDEVFEEIILKKFVKEDFQEEFKTNMLSDENCSTGLKMKVVFRTGLLNKYAKLKDNIITLIEIRNTIAHSKYRPTVQTVEVLHKKQVSDIKTLKSTFDTMFKETISKLNEILTKI